jgi:hypothetical protein
MSTQAATTPAVTHREIRLWAQRLRLPVSDSGPLPAAVIERYRREHPDAVVAAGRRIEIKSGPEFGRRGAQARWGT